MAILAGIASMLGRFAGQLLQTTLGWATLLLFGKVPADRQLLLLFIVFGSLLWVVLVIGVLVPTVGTLLLTGVPIASFIDIGWIRLVMLGGALLLPAVVGGMAAMLTEKDSRKRGLDLVTAILRGYPFAAVLSLVMVELALVAIVRKVRSLAKRWQDTHVPIVVKPGKYDRMLAMLSDTLEAAGLDHERRSAGRLISEPPKLLDLVAGRALGSLVPNRLMLLAGPDFEALVYPSDVAISGTAERVARARAAVSVRLAHAPAYLTTAAEAQHFEDELGNVKAPAELRPLDEKLARLVVPYEQWDVLYRERLQIEVELLGQRDAILDAEPTDQRETVRTARPKPVDLAVAGVGLGLIALDAALLLASRQPRRD